MWTTRIQRPSSTCRTPFRGTAVRSTSASGGSSRTDFVSSRTDVVVELSLVVEPDPVGEGLIRQHVYLDLGVDPAQGVAEAVREADVRTRASCELHLHPRSRGRNRQTERSG